MKKPWYLYKWIWIVVSVMSWLVPYAINEAYQCKSEKVYITEWGAADVLSFYGSFLSFAGSVVLGLVAVEQSRKANHLSERMLDLEERQEIPILDVMEIVDGEEPTNKDVLKNALRLTINERFYYLEEDNTLGDSNTDVLVFAIKNISDNHIISMNVTGVTHTTAFSNEKCVTTEAKTISWTGGVRVFGGGDCQYMVIGGVEFEYPPSMTTDEAFEQGYYNPTSILEFCFTLKNARGKTYEERIRIRAVYIPNDSGINYPCIVEKEIISVLPTKEK